MLWTDLFYMIVITTFTGSVLTVAWLITQRRAKGIYDGCW